MDLEIVGKEMDNLTQQAQKLIDLIRKLQEGKMFDEPLTTAMKANLTNQAKSRWLAIRDAVVYITQEINK